VELHRDPAEVHLWITDPATLTGAQRDAYLALCSGDELARDARITHEETRRNHLIARALVRTTLSRYGEPEPAAWRFEENDHGCPFIAADQNPDGLRFNLSHTTGLVVCAVTRGRDVGVDVEYEPRDSRTTKIADRFFAPCEVDALHRLPESEHRARFFAYWTLKESYIKARGMGLAIPLKRFWFDVDTPGQLCFDNDPELGDDPKRWAFARLRTGPDHPMAVALECPAGEAFALRAFETVPLGADRELPCQPFARSIP